MRIAVEKAREKIDCNNTDLAKLIPCDKQWLTNASKEYKISKGERFLIRLSIVTGLSIDELCVNTEEEEDYREKVAALSWIKKNIQNCDTEEQREKAEKLLEFYNNLNK